MFWGFHFRPGAGRRLATPAHFIHVGPFEGLRSTAYQGKLRKVPQTIRTREVINS